MTIKTFKQKNNNNYTQRKSTWHT